VPDVALVTGGSRGVGRAIAAALAGRGAAVCLLARTSSEVERAAAELGGLGLAVDVTDRPAVEAAVAKAEGELGAVTLLVNNAGTLDAIGPFWELDPDAWWRELESHVRGSVLCTRAVLPGMVERGHGRIVNVVGLLGQFGDGYASAYACAKAALFRLTDLLGAELEGTGVHVFCVSPGAVETAMTKRLAESAVGRRWLPEFSELAASGGWVSAQRGADLVARIAAGELDALSGRYVHVSMDADRLIRESDAIREADRLVLRVVE
jgi:NAD(P)-dependent dehydrogenase (short-subunit alcohol dehydrogenase family)